MSGLSHPFMTPFGEQLHQDRQVRGISLEQLAAGASLPLSTLSAIESGARLPLTEGVVNMLAKTLGLAGNERSLFLTAGKLKRASAADWCHGAWGWVSWPRKPCS